MMGSEGSAKQRKHKRVLIMQELAVDGKPAGQAIDLSIDGMYIATRSPFTKDAVHVLTFQLAGDPMELKARVMYLHEGIGMGVRFVSLKAEDAERIHGYITTVSTARQIRPKSSRKQILIIDDSDFYRTVYEHRLLSEGYSVLVARNGIEGLKILTQERPDLILLDLIMDGMDGYKVLQVIKSEPEIKDIPVVIFSVKGTTQAVSLAIALGATDYLAKATTTPHQMIKKIKKVFQHSPSVS